MTFMSVLIAVTGLLEKAKSVAVIHITLLYLRIMIGIEQEFFISV
jgi:hypothetical protein